MAAGVVTIGRRQYASGLYWENSPSGRVSQAAKEAARQPGVQARFYAARPGNKAGRVPQFGLSAAQTEHKSGLPALAACLANQQPGSWAGAFRLREGTALVVVRDDLLVPDGDQFFLDESEARDRLLQEMALGGLQRVYAPETWGVSGADTMPVGLLLSDRTDVRLRQVSLPKSTKRVLTGGVILLLIVLGAGWYIQQQKAEEEARRLRMLSEIERKKREAEALLAKKRTEKPPYPEPERKWEKEPDPMKVVEACRAGLVQLELAVAGWRSGGVRCNGKSISQSWSRSGGFSSPPHNAKVTDSASGATFSITLSAIEPRGKQDLVDPDEITRRYLAQNWPGSINRVADDPPPPPPAGYKGEWKPPPPPWVKRSFTVSAPVLPGALPVFFGDLPGVVINSMSLSSPGLSGTWTVEGVIYENRR